MIKDALQLTRSGSKAQITEQAKLLALQMMASHSEDPADLVFAMRRLADLAAAMFDSAKHQLAELVVAKEATLDGYPEMRMVKSSGTVSAIGDTELEELQHSIRAKTDALDALTAPLKAEIKALEQAVNLRLQTLAKKQAAGVDTGCVVAVEKESYTIAIKY
jgi:hypothetical protein